jgi:hypothetical protein
MRPGACRVEQERFAYAAVRVEDGRVDSMMDDADASWIEPEIAYRTVAHKRAWNDHPIGVTSGAIVREPPEQPHVTGYKRWKVEVQQVVQRHDPRLRRRRHGNRERVVDDVGRGERIACSSRAQERQRA